MHISLSKTSREVKRDRKPYYKPQIEKIKLILEEAVLGLGCKTDQQVGQGITGCGIPVNPVFPRNVELYMVFRDEGQDAGGIFSRDGSSSGNHHS